MRTLSNENLILKISPLIHRKKPRTPTTKNGKLVITFKVLGTPVNYTHNKIRTISNPQRNRRA